MRASPLLALTLSVALSGCATLGLGGPSEEEARLDAGLAALEAGDYAAAVEHLEWTARTHPDEDEGVRATLVLAALELDPRNPLRRLWATTDLVDRYLALEDAPAWTHPVAESLYQVAAEMGAAEARAEDAEAENRQLRYEGRTFPERLQEVATARDAAAQERDQLQTRVANLERAVGTRNDSIAALNKEIERIRKLIKP